MIELLTAGIHSSIQDLGRFGYRKYGVPLSGAMDRKAAVTANTLVGNQPDCPVLEFTLSGPTLHFKSTTRIAITGAHFSPKIAQTNLSMNEAHLITQNTTLKLGNCASGVYGYLAVAGGFDLPRVMGSHSQYEGITSTSQLNKKACIPLYDTAISPSYFGAGIKTNQSYLDTSEIIVYPGPEYHLLSDTMREELARTSFQLSADCSRMGYRLENTLNDGAPEIITAPVQPGTVQLTPSGQLIILMRDAQTTGGYARVLQLTEASLCSLAQQRIAQKITFSIRAKRFD